MKQVIGEKQILIELKLALGCSLEMTQFHQIKVLISSLKWYYFRNIVEYAYRLYFQEIFSMQAKVSCKLLWILFNQQMFAIKTNQNLCHCISSLVYLRYVFVNGWKSQSFHFIFDQPCTKLACKTNCKILCMNPWTICSKTVWKIIFRQTKYKLLTVRHGRNLVGDTGSCVHHFFRRGHIICRVAPTFSLGFVF